MHSAGSRCGGSTTTLRNLRAHSRDSTRRCPRGFGSPSHSISHLFAPPRPSSPLRCLAAHRRAAMDQAGFTLVECPARGAKEVIDKKIIVDVMEFGLTHANCGAACTVVLITSDGDYAYMLSRLRDLQVHVVLVYDRGCVAPNLLHTCDHALDWQAHLLPSCQRLSLSSTPHQPIIRGLQRQKQGGMSAGRRGTEGAAREDEGTDDEMMAMLRGSAFAASIFQAGGQAGGPDGDDGDGNGDADLSRGHPPKKKSSHKRMAALSAPGALEWSEEKGCLPLRPSPGKRSKGPGGKGISKAVGKANPGRGARKREGKGMNHVQGKKAKGKAKGKGKGKAKGKGR